jgi:hypothetical protein
MHTTGILTTSIVGRPRATSISTTSSVQRSHATVLLISGAIMVALGDALPVAQIHRPPVGFCLVVDRAMT